MSDILTQAIELLDDMSFSDLLSLNQQLAVALRKKRGSKSAGGGGGGEKKTRPLALGTAAWIAFVKYCKTEYEDRFDGLKKEAEKLAVCKEIRAEDPELYEEFVARFKAENGAEEESEEEEVKPKKATPTPKKATPAPAKKEASLAAAAKKTPEAKPKAPTPAPKKTKKSATSDSESEAEAPTPVSNMAAKMKAMKEAAAAKKAAAEAKKAEEAAAAAAKKAKSPSAEAEEAGLDKITINETQYFLEKDSGALFMVLDDGSLGAQIGTYAPEEEDQIKWD